MLTAVAIAISSSSQSPVQDLLRCAKHLFVGAMVAWVHLGPATNRQIRRQRGNPRSERVKFSGAAKAKRRRSCEVDRLSLANRRLSRPSPVRSCCFAPNICSSLPWWLGFIRACRESPLPMMAGIHPGLPRIGKSGHDGGASAFESVKCSRGQQKQSAAVITGRRALAPVLRFVIPGQRFVHGSHGVTFPWGGRT